jgi:chemotaxis response regulator CheB
MNKKIRILIVDDSALVRQTLTSIYSSDPDIEVIGAAGDPFAAAEIMREQAPDVLSLDVEMPHGRNHVPEKDHDPASHPDHHLLHPDRKKR